MFIFLSALCIIAEIFAVRHYMKIMYPVIGPKTLFSKLLCSALFVLLALFGILYSGGINEFSIFMLVGFLCSFLGDGFLHMYPKLGSVYVNYILGGLSFLSGHIFFITAILKADRAVFPDTPMFPAKQLIAAALLDFAVIAVMLLCKLKLGKFLVPVAVYAFALMMTVVKAFSLGTAFMSAGSLIAVVFSLTLGLGSSLFAASDLVLASDFFTGGKDIKKKKTNIILYYCGQMLMALSVMFSAVSIYFVPTV